MESYITYLSILWTVLANEMKKLVIVDNDCGIDDAWALNFLMNCGNGVEILAITCVNGNSDVDNVCRNNLYFLSVAGKSGVNLIP